jgi:hypothetical protein
VTDEESCRKPEFRVVLKVTRGLRRGGPHAANTDPVYLGKVMYVYYHGAQSYSKYCSNSYTLTIGEKVPRYIIL